MKVKVCAGARCTMLGSDIIFNRLSDFVEDFNNHVYNQKIIEDDITLEIEMVNCLDYCKENKKCAPIVEVDDKVFCKAKTQEIMEYILDKAFEKNFNN